jgi:hypothetical protein
MMLSLEFYLLTAIMSSRKTAGTNDLLALKDDAQLLIETESQVHIIKPGFACKTESRARSRAEIEASLVVGATDGSISLWKENQVLYWRFDEVSLRPFRNSAKIMEIIQKMLFGAIGAWGDSAPIRFKENTDVYDFQVSVMTADLRQGSGLVAASSFFPGDGRKSKLRLYPTFFRSDDLTDNERLETLIHELGHIFGLRHFFAAENDPLFSGGVFGVHNKLTIMNYGANSKLTNDDKNDLKSLYKAAWTGNLTNVNRTPIRLVTSPHIM